MMVKRDQSQIKIQNVKELIVQTAIQSSDFKDLLEDSLTDIKSHAASADNEADIESLFEHELYALLKKLNIKFIPRKEVAIATKRHIGKGRMDSKIGAVVIEYKHRSKLTKSTDIKKASDQIKNYLSSLSQGTQIRYYGFLTDGLKCKEFIFENDVLKSESALVDLSFIEAKRLIENIVLAEKTALLPENLIRDFCLDEKIVEKMANSFFLILKNKPTHKTKMLRTEWEQLFRLGHDDISQQKTILEREQELQRIFGVTFEHNDQYLALFSLQTTYSIIIKLMAFRIVSELKFERKPRSYNSVLTANDENLRIFCQRLEDGEIFRDIGIINLLEGDFFSWYSDKQQWNAEIAKYIRKILEILIRYENASEVFNKERGIDLFRGLYEKIIPAKVRSSLGEFYTPYWLANHVFNSVHPTGRWRGLDPCAGSGTFILVMIDETLKELKDQPQKSKLDEILDRIHAIDLNPLAVLTTRINYFIRICHLIPSRPGHLEIPVYLGDASYVPERVKISGIECLKYSISTIESPIEIILPNSMIADTQKFSHLMLNYEQLIKRRDFDGAFGLLIENLPERDKKTETINELKRLTTQLVELERKKWNGIWARIITNFLITANIGKFNIIIGNPPWIDWKNLPSGYRNRIKSLCIDRKLFSGDGRTGGINLNICALISSVSMDNWLEEDGHLAFLMPKVIAFQQSYDGYRQFESQKIKREFLAFYDWSYAGHPFHPVTERFMTYVIGKRRNIKKPIPVVCYKKKLKAKIAGQSYLTLAEAMGNLQAVHAVAGQIMPHNTAYTIAKDIAELNSFELIAGEADYIGREGIEFYPQELQLLKVAENPPTAPGAGLIYVTNLQFEKSKYEIPENTFELEKKYLFPLVKGPEIKQFAHEYSNILVPFPYDKTNPKQPLSRNQLRGTKLLEFYDRYETFIKEQTGYSDSIRGPDPGEFYGLARVGPYSFADYYVAFRDNTKWGAVVISPTQMPWGERKRFLFQNHAVSMCESIDGRIITEDEAHYICAILNAPIVEQYLLKSSDSRSYKIRPPVKIPRYNNNDTNHLKLRDLSKRAHTHHNEIDGIRKEINEVYLKILQ